MSRPREETIRRLRLGDLQKVLRWRYGPTLPDDDAGRDDLRLLLQTISMGQGDWTKLKNAIEVWAPWMNAGEALQLIDEVTIVHRTICASPRHARWARSWVC